jgi:hypothetical protein
MICKIEGCSRPAENEQTGLCATHAFQARKAARNPKQAHRPRINPVSDKMKSRLSEYSQIKKNWIKGKRCAVFPEKWATDVHHKKGRIGFADKWARDNNIPLLIDTRFWLPVSREGHIKIGDLQAWAMEQGFTLPRNEEK